MRPEVVTDGRVVWVNTGMCLGRFSPQGAEVYFELGAPYVMGPSWSAWTTVLFVKHGYLVAEGFKPAWAHNGT